MHEKCSKYMCLLSCKRRITDLSIANNLLSFAAITQEIFPFAKIPFGKFPSTKSEGNDNHCDDTTQKEDNHN